jgi:RNA polymerase sigma-B factor
MKTARPPMAEPRLAALLEAYLEQPSLKRRNAVVHANLPLVWQVARRESLRTGACFDDLVQVGAIGLIKAVERFDPRMGNTLSTAAVPWIRGAIRHYLRDQGRPLSGSRSLVELLQRARQLQDGRGRQGLSPLGEPELLTALGCSAVRWREAQQLQQALRLVSLDQTVTSEEGELAPLVEQLPDRSISDRYGQLMRQEQRRLLWSSLNQLQAAQRNLLLDRILAGQSWRELGQPLKLSGKAAQKQFQTLIEQLRRQLEPQLSAG